MINRRTFTVSTAAMALSTLSGCTSRRDLTETYGLISKILVQNNSREELISVLLAGTAEMPGCLSYVISKEMTDENALWITEVWDSKESHQASLSLESVKEAMAKGKPLIAGFGERVETIPVGGQGLS